MGSVISKTVMFLFYLYLCRNLVQNIAWARTASSSQGVSEWRQLKIVHGSILVNFYMLMMIPQL